MPDRLTNFDLDSLSVDPTEVKKQNLDINIALRDTAKNRQRQYEGLIETAVNIDEVTADLQMDNLRREVTAAQELEKLYATAETTLGEMNTRSQAVHNQLNRVTAESLELRNAIDSGELGLIERFQANRQLSKLNRQYDRLSTAAGNMVQQKEQYMYGVQTTTDKINNRTAIQNQANINTEAVERSMQLENKARRIELAIAGDDDTIRTIERMRTLDPSQMAQEERDSMDIFEMMHVMQTGSIEGYTKEASRALQGIYSEFDQRDRTAIQWANYEYMRAKAAGVTLTPEDLIGMAMRQSDIHAVEVLSRLYEDPTLFESIQDAKGNLVAREFQRLSDQLLSAEDRLDPQLSDSEIRSISQQAQESLNKMSGRQLFGAVQNEITRDVQNYTQTTGTEMFAAAADNPADLVPEHFPQVREYLQTDQARLRLTKPDVRDNFGQGSVLQSMIQDMREARIPDSQIFNGLAEFTSNAAKANYSHRSDFGRGTYADTMAELERFGMDFSQNLAVAPYPSSRRIPVPEGQQTTLNLGSASDLQKYTEALSQFRKRRENMQQGVREAARRSVPQGFGSFDPSRAAEARRSEREGNQE